MQPRQLHAVHPAAARGLLRRRSSRATWSARCAGCCGVRSSWCITADVAGDRPGWPGRERAWAATATSHRLRYDTLVLALGGVTHTFGIPGIEEHAVGMKTLADAFSLRNRMIEILERADLEEDPDEKRAAADLRGGRRRILRRRDGGRGRGLRAPRAEALLPEAARRTEVSAYLVELRDQILPEMPAEMGDYARRQLERRGLRGADRHARSRRCARTRSSSARATRERTIPTRTVIWTGGVRPAPLVAECGVEVDRGRSRDGATDHGHQPRGRVRHRRLRA